jgi:hypothetical protein
MCRTFESVVLEKRGKERKTREDDRNFSCKLGVNTRDAEREVTEER